jgi:acyl carrier protein
MSSASNPAAHLQRPDVTALRILARSLVRELRKRDYGSRHVVALANELIGLACEAIRAGGGPAAQGDGRRQDAARGGDMTQQQLDAKWTEFRALVADKFGTHVDGVQREAAFIADLGADSLDMIQILMELEDRYQIAIPEAEVMRLVTVGDAFDYVVARTAA